MPRKFDCGGVRGERNASGIGRETDLRALRSGMAEAVYIAEDASPQVTDPVAAAAEEAGIPVTLSPTMRELGRFCGIAVGCSCAARLK